MSLPPRELVHDHDLSAASITVISSFTVPPVAIHRVMHAGSAPAATIRAYSPPLTRTGVYRVGESGELQRESLLLEQELRAEPSLS